MNISGISAASAVGSSQQVQGPSQHKHGKKLSISDIDSLGSSVASGPSSTSKAGNKVNITA